MSDLATLVEVGSADVYKSGLLVARFQRHDDHVSLTYLPGHSNGLAIATTLPVGDGPTRTPGRSVPPYFAGLLPEGRRLTALRTALKTSADDDFSMLLAVGGDTVGNVQVVPAGSPPPDITGREVETGPLETISFPELFERATGASPDRGGIAGVQDKVSGRMISLPVRAAGAGYLLKLDPPEFPQLVANEAFFIGLSRDCGIPTVDAEMVHDRDGRPGLLVQRFDRIADKGAARALAVEDGCQVLARYPADKYALTTEQVVLALSRHCAARLPALRAAFRQIVLALVTGNGDLHAKNLSILHDGHEWTLAPAYDLPSSYPYGDSTLAMSIQKSREGQVSRRRLLAFASEVGLPERAAILTLDDLLDRVEPWVTRTEQLPFDERRIHRLQRFMRARIGLLRG